VADFFNGCFEWEIMMKDLVVEVIAGIKQELNF
jgi:hypothetical protein